MFDEPVLVRHSPSLSYIMNSCYYYYYYIIIHLVKAIKGQDGGVVAASKLTYDDVGLFDTLESCNKDFAGLDLWKGHPETEEIVKTLYQNLVSRSKELDVYNAYAHTFKCRHNISRHRGFHLKGNKNEVGVRYPYADPLVDMLCEGHGYKLELEDTMAGAVNNNSYSIVSEKSKADYVCWIITHDGKGKELPVAVVVLEAKHITTINKNGIARVLGYYCRSKGTHDNKTDVAILFNEYQDTVQVRFFLFLYQKNTEGYGIQSLFPLHQCKHEQFLHRGFIDLFYLFTFQMN